MRPDRGADVVVVAGAMHGAGSSTVAALMALAAARCRRRTLLVETDSSPVHQWLTGNRDPGSISNRLGSSRVSEFLSIAGPGSQAVHSAADLVVIDAGWNAATLMQACASGVDRVLVVVTPGHAPVSAGYALVKLVERRFPGTRFEIVVNRTGPEPGPALFDALQTAALSFLRRAVALAAMLPDDACLQPALRAGMSLEDACVGSGLDDAIHALVTSTLSQFDHARMAWSAGMT
jgi:MinD-like ATPase involved in chromosome partitioning or flagellar assembly